MKAITQSGKDVFLDDAAEIHRGGEGKILLLKELPGQVAKVYLNPCKAITAAQVQTLQQLDRRYFVSPTELLLEKATGTPVGFTMPYLGTDFFPLSSLFSVQFCQRHHIDEAQKLQLARVISQAISHAHQQQIVIGDLSGLNLLVNRKGELKFIDIDAYGTSARSHSGVLLDEIRDYFYQGEVSQQSDYFAYSVLVFNLLTFVHPYKGVHKTCKSLQERMVKCIPVFADDPQLILPKCYQPVREPVLQQQFEAMFMKGVRALLQPDAQPAATAHPVTPKPVAQVPAAKTELNIKAVYQPQPGEHLLDISCLQQQLLLKTTRQYLVFDCGNYGYVQLRHTFPVDRMDDVFAGEKNVLGRKGNQLLVFREDTGFEPLRNFSFTAESRMIQLHNILAVVEDDYLKLLYLDEVNRDFIRLEQTPAFGKGLHIGNGGLWQQAGGKQYLFYHSGKTLSSVLSPVLLHDVHIAGNHGLLSYRDMAINESSIRHTYFSLQNLHFKLSSATTEGIKTFSFKPGNAPHGLIFEPADDKLLVRRTEDFAVVQEIDCKMLSAQSRLFTTAAGIVAMEGDECCLLNKKH